MFLSRLTFNTRSSLARKQLAEPYQLHRTLLKAFQEGGVHMPRSNSEAHGVLYRIERHPDSQSHCALIQSVSAPNWSPLAALRDDQGQLFLLNPPECRSFSPDVEAGKVYAFRLRANPTKRVAETGQRVGYYHEEDQLRWLHRKLLALDSSVAEGQNVAVNIRHVYVSHEGDVTNHIRRNNAISRITLTSAQFDGVLEVIEPTWVGALIRNGVGSAKGFGFGLLSLRRVD